MYVMLSSRNKIIIILFSEASSILEGREPPHDSQSTLTNIHLTNNERHNTPATVNSKLIKQELLGSPTKI